MQYEEIVVDAMGKTSTHIIVANEDGTFRSFPADESNPEYVAFIEDNPDALG